MENEWIQNWEKQVGIKVYLPGTTSTSKNLEIALKFSQCGKNYDK